MKDLVAALNESKGSAAEYREVRLELRALERALLEVEILSRSHAATAKLNALYAMQIRWQESQKREITRIRAHSSSINMLLLTVNV